LGESDHALGKLVANATHVYWSEQAGEPVEGGIFRVAK
jgi:hypothetical protein